MDKAGLENTASTSSWTPKSSIESPSLSEPALTPTPFTGGDKTNAREWLTYFTRYITFKQLSETATIALFALLMRGPANTWFTGLTDEERSSYKAVCEQFKKKYSPAPITLWRRASDFWATEQQPGQSVEEYYSEMRCKGQEIEATDDMVRYAIMRGLRANLRPYVMQQDPATPEGLLEAAKVAEATIEDSTPLNSAILEAINRVEQRVSAPVVASTSITSYEIYFSSSGSQKVFK